MECWRCRMCGKWSHAKRRPSAHERYLHVGWDEPVSPWTHPTSKRGGYTVACGPFDRYVVTPEDPQPPPDLVGAGVRVIRDDRWDMEASF